MLPNRPWHSEDTNQYGMDTKDGHRLAELLRDLSELKGLHWIRILYAYPSYFTDSLIDEIANNPKVCILIYRWESMFIHFPSQWRPKDPLSEIWQRSHNRGSASSHKRIIRLWQPSPFQQLTSATALCSPPCLGFFGSPWFPLHVNLPTASASFC